MKNTTRIKNIMCMLKKEMVKPSLCAFEDAEKQLIESFKFLDNARLPGNAPEAQEYNEIIVKNLISIKFLRAQLVRTKWNLYPDTKPYDPMNIVP